MEENLIKLFVKDSRQFVSKPVPPEQFKHWGTEDFQRLVENLRNPKLCRDLGAGTEPCKCGQWWRVQMRDRDSITPDSRDGGLWDFCPNCAETFGYTF
jgi:hypothetical protein